MRTAEGSTVGHITAHASTNVGGRAHAAQQRTQLTSANDPAWLFTSVAMLGIAALSSAAASSLLPGLSGLYDGGSSSGGNGNLPLGIAGVFSAVYGLSALAYGLLALRHGKLIRAEVVLVVLAIGAGVHLIGLLLGLWQLPLEERTFDTTLATLLILELCATAVLGWHRNAQLRRLASQNYRTFATSRANSAASHSSRPAVALAATAAPRSAAAVVGMLFAISLFVAALTTVGMAASTAGELAVPHSGHGESVPGDSGHKDHDNHVIPENIQRLKDQGHHH